MDVSVATKLRAGRGRRVTLDIDRLLDACGVDSLVSAERIFERYFPHDAIADIALPRGQVGS